MPNLQLVWAHKSPTATPAFNFHIALVPWLCFYSPAKIRLYFTEYFTSGIHQVLKKKIVSSWNQTQYCGYETTMLATRLMPPRTICFSDFSLSNKCSETFDPFQFLFFSTEGEKRWIGFCLLHRMLKLSVSLSLTHKHTCTHPHSHTTLVQTDTPMYMYVHTHTHPLSNFGIWETIFSLARAITRWFKTKIL